jgi:glycerol-3-phosphate O-acyltransferase
MAPRFGSLATLFGRRFFAGFGLKADEAARLRELGERGSVVYVMRYSSRLDYFLFNWLFLATGLELSSFANGIHFFYYRPLGEALRLLWRSASARLRLGRQGARNAELVGLRGLVREGGTAFLFLRSDKMGSRLRRRAKAVVAGRSELDYLREIVDTRFAHSQPVSLVPLALFWRKGARPQRPFLNLFYGGPERPTDVGKVISFLWNYRNLAVRVGTAIDLGAFVDEHRAEGRDRIVKQVRRSLLIFLRREEKPIIGAALRSFQHIQDTVLSDAAVVQAVTEASAAGSLARVRAKGRARRYLREIAANQSPTMLAILSVVVGAIFRRVFGRFVVHGIERTVEAAKLHPLVLVPSHRSHFDYLILSWLFYERHLVPPHVAAGNNLSFWPLGPIFRRSGAFFLRRSFEGNQLYTAVFRSYVQFLIKDGASQEFFIEGTRSRTGKTLPPRLGMLGMVLEAYARGARRELYLIPVGFTYERLAEERSLTEERGGKSKRRENLFQLIKARRILRYRFGHVIVRFGEPVAASEYARRRSSEGGAAEAQDLRAATERLGIELSRRINELITAGRTSVASAALLGSSVQGAREADFAERVCETDALLRLLDVPRSLPLERCMKGDEPEKTVDLLLKNGLVTRTHSHGGNVLKLREGARETLDYYRSTILPSLAWPAAVALALREPRSPSDLCEAASSWLDLLRIEFFPREGEARLRRLERIRAHLLERGWIREQQDDRLEATAEGARWLEFLRAQLAPLLECYHAVFSAVAEAEGKGQRDSLIALASELQREHLVLGEARFPEGAGPVAAGNALWLLVQERVLACDGVPTRPEASFVPGERWGELPELQLRLAQVLRTP